MYCSTWTARHASALVLLDSSTLRFSFCWASSVSIAPPNKLRTKCWFTLPRKSRKEETEHRTFETLSIPSHRKRALTRSWTPSNIDRQLGHKRAWRHLWALSCRQRFRQHWLYAIGSHQSKRPIFDRHQRRLERQDLAFVARCCFEERREEMRAGRQILLRFPMLLQWARAEEEL